jgi:hypothetical protein
LLEIIKVQRQRIAELEQAENLLKLQRKIWKNPDFNPADKLWLATAYETAVKAEVHDTDGRSRLNHTTIAGKIGMSAKTSSRIQKRFETRCPDLLDIAKHEEEAPNGEQTERT